MRALAEAKGKVRPLRTVRETARLGDMEEKSQIDHP